MSVIMIAVQLDYPVVLRAQCKPDTTSGLRE